MLVFRFACFFLNLLEMFTEGAVFCSKHQTKSNQLFLFCLARVTEQLECLFFQILKRGDIDRDELSMFSPWP